MTDVMMDLETYGQRPGCGIVSIGAVAFGESGLLGDYFYAVISRESSKGVGLFEDISTLKWWSTQPAEVRRTLDEAESGDHIFTVLDKFSAWLNQFDQNKVRVWGNGSDFDNAILGVAYAHCGKTVPWRFWNNRCYRTVKSFHPHIKIDRLEGDHHNALADAKNQAVHLMKMINPK